MPSVHSSKSRRKLKAKNNEKSLEEVLEQLSDDDDEEGDEGDNDKTPITKSFLRSLEESLSKSDCTISTIKQLMLVFRAVVEKSGGDVPESKFYLPDDSASFNTILRLCFTYLPTVWERVLGIVAADVAKIGKVKWKKAKDLIKGYLFDLLKFLPEIQENQVRILVLKHLAQIIDYFLHFPKQAKFLLKALIAIWITKNEENKILSFVCIMKLVKIMKTEMLEFTLKKMYLSITKTTTVVTPNSLPGLEFMRKSYAELCGLDLNLTYQQGFMYIRQMAILLRNAIVSKKKDTVGAIYGWPFVHCLYLWCRVLNSLKNEENIRPLFYPLIQVIVGCSKLLPTAKYIPVRLHCVKCLLILNEETNYHVPVLSVLIEIMNSVNFKKQNTRQALKPPDFDCIIKLSTSQLDEFDYKPVAVERICDFLLEIMHRQCLSPAFSEFAFYLLLRLKGFSKQSRNAELSRNVRLLLMKIQEHCSWIEEQKAKSSIQLNDPKTLYSFRKRLTNQSSGPIGKYYVSYQKMKERQSRVKLAANNSEPIFGEKRKRVTFTSEDEIDVGQKKVKKVEKPKNEKRKSVDKKSSLFTSDIVKDFSLADLKEK